MSPQGNPPLDQMMSTQKFGLGDIYYTVFRHKWKLVLCALLGIAAGAFYYLTRVDLYKSDAKLFIRYVVSDASGVGTEHDAMKGGIQVQRGASIMGSESQILISMDLCQRVAEVFGPEKILKAYNPDDPNDVAMAAAMVRYGLSVSSPNNDGVIAIAFTHPDVEVVRPLLRVVISEYLKKHVEVHSAMGAMGNFLSRETDQLRVRLAQTEADLRKAKRTAGVIDSVEETQRTISAEISRYRQAIFEANADLAQQTAVYEAMTNTLVEQQKTAKQEDVLEDKPKVPPEKLEAVRRLSNRIAILERMEQDLLTRYTTENTQVRDVQVQLAEAEESRRQIIVEYPHIKDSQVAMDMPAERRDPNAFDPQRAGSEIKALQTKIEVMNEQFQSRLQQAMIVNDMEDAIRELSRKRDMEDATYRNYVASLEDSRIQSTLGNGALPNISQIQTPSAPYLDNSSRKMRSGILAVGGAAVGLVWALALELFIDQKVRRPVEVESRLGIPFFLAIPQVRSSMLRRERRLKKKALKQRAKAPEVTLSMLPVDNEIGVLSPFYETLRDRMMHFFESRQMERKPKLIAITSINHGAGASTIAAGLSRSFSYSEEGNVLLVDLTGKNGAVRQFLNGEEVKEIDGLLNEADASPLRENLFLVTEKGASAELSRHLPRRFNRLVPWLKSSDFDYIIFDMPPVSQISITPRLAGFMDMILLILEAEQSDRDMAKKAAKLLRVSQPNVTAVLNKTQSYVPSRLHQEFSLTQ